MSWLAQHMRLYLIQGYTGRHSQPLQQHYALRRVVTLVTHLTALVRVL
jgi:hypothetical protein